MTKSGEFRMEILNEDDGIYYLDVSGSNGLFSSSIQDYFSLEDFVSFGERLQTFPQNTDDKVVFEHGKNSDKYKWRTYLSLTTYIYDHRGYALLEIIARNNGAPQVAASAQYSIRSEIASLNNFGRELIDWTKSLDKVFVHDFFCDF
jgi:hypothetical protein